jgi:hypothetical protein
LAAVVSPLTVREAVAYDTGSEVFSSISLSLTVNVVCANATCPTRIRAKDMIILLKKRSKIFFIV